MHYDLVLRNDRTTATRSGIKRETEREQGGREGGGREGERDLVLRNDDKSNGDTQWYHEDTYTAV